MRKALWIADGRLDEDPIQLNIDEVQCLIDLYPVVLRTVEVHIFTLLYELKTLHLLELKKDWCTSTK
ncbi:hypothetical protein TNIN_383661 [Trichonephila inaurata madagascariensis]|uniref:Uncharacterized protein n=1 Tax=Trichonephila inaurata madagascariensis TaxID=2747483 RepID=A0A8X6XPB4_9ARAC|nr:hypothetical protein TNIN_383661 [Trichonephila inaurata madagascariensis]